MKGSSLVHQSQVVTDIVFSFLSSHRQFLLSCGFQMFSPDCTKCAARSLVVMPRARRMHKCGFVFTETKSCRHSTGSLKRDVRRETEIRAESLAFDVGPEHDLAPNLHQTMRV